MTILLSPAKSLDLDFKNKIGENKTPVFKKECLELVKILKKKSRGEIKNLMSLSDNLSELNYNRYQDFSNDFTEKNSKQAIFAFTGDVYKSFDSLSLSEADIKYADEHIKILSGLYGLISPLDYIQPYRLEMGTRLENKKGANLYHFWQEVLTDYLNKNADDIIINLASGEYIKAVKIKSLNKIFVDIDFKDRKNGQYKTIGINAKKARGKMARYLVTNRIENIDTIKKFSEDEYMFNAELSNLDSKSQKLVFTRG